MAVFDGVHYVLSSSISAEHRKELLGLLELNGATSAPPHTHLIAPAGSHIQHELAGSLHVVSEMWVQRSIVLGKLQLEQYYSPDPTMIFSGIVACATDLSPSDLEVMSAGITSLGGQWRTGLTRDVTHLFALHEQSDKYQTAMHFAPHTHMSILTPHWFDDSVRVGRRVPEGSYLWPDPKVLQPGVQVPVAEDEAEMVGNGKRKRRKSGETGSTSPILKRDADHNDRIKVWAGKTLLLSRSLELGKGHREAVQANVARAGGTVVEVKDTSVDEEAQEEEEEALVDECDVFVTRYRSGKAYFKAARSSRPILIGNLSWMFHVDACGTMNDPRDSLLWYPVPRGGIRDLHNCEITVTNYTGAARDYLKKLIQIMGANFTPSMSQSNKFLVAGYSPSPKTQRAVAWSIPIVNHTWLEDCFIAWKNLTVGVDKYILYPPGVDFGKMLMTPIGGTGASTSANTSTNFISSGGPVPGGRGVGPIDVDEEEQRDMEYRRNLSIADVVDEADLVTSRASTPQRKFENSNGEAKTASSKKQLSMVDVDEAHLVTSRAGTPQRKNENANGEAKAASSKPKSKPQVVVEVQKTPLASKPKRKSVKPKSGPKLKTQPKHNTKETPQRASPSPSSSLSDIDVEEGGAPPKPKETPQRTTYDYRTPSKRSAASKATNKLRDEIMPDVVNFEKEKKNAKRRRASGLNDSFGPLVRDEEEVEVEVGLKRDGKRRKVEKAREEEVGMKRDGKRRRVEEEEKKEDEEDEAEVEEVISSSVIPRTKSKSKMGRAQPSGSSRESGAVRVMTTGTQLSDDTIKRLNKLGAKMTTKANDCTHLVAKGIVRTEKFLCAIASSPFILTEGWVTMSVQAGKLLPETDFMISDRESERKWNFKLCDSLERAKGEDGGDKLLKGMMFYVTPKVEIDMKLLKAVVGSAGGQVQTTTKPTVRIMKANEKRHVISCAADRSMWRALVEEGYSVYSTELILLAVLTQEIRWKDESCICSAPSSSSSSS